MTTATPNDDRPAAESANVYRCPGCGEMVDGSCMSEVLRHHQHVLYAVIRPTWEQNTTTSGARAITNVAAQSSDERNGRLDAAPENDSERLAAARLRRYGHS